MSGELRSLCQQTLRIDFSFLAGRPHWIVVSVHWRTQIENFLVGEENLFFCSEQRRAAIPPFLLMSSLSTCVGTRLEQVRPRSLFVVRQTDAALTPISLAISRILLLLPGWSSCEQISSATMATL